MTMNMNALGVISCLILVSCSCTLAASCTPGQKSTTGVIQIYESSCLDSTSNGLPFLCGAAFKVDVNAKGIMYLTPAVKGSLFWAGPGPSSPPNNNQGNFACKDMNATGSFDAANKKAANVKFYNDVLGPFSRLVASSPSKITLISGNTASYKSPSPNCTANYTVVSGCVLGVPASKPRTCPKGWYLASGNFGVKYCTACPPGTSSGSVNSNKCTPCPAGTANGVYAGVCQKCTGSSFTTKTGQTYCDYCFVSGWTYDPTGSPPVYIDAKKGCVKCPADSWASDLNPSQCAACSPTGARCCRTNPSSSCPPCPAGFKSSTKNFTAKYVLDSVSPAICYKGPDAVCTTAFTVTVTGRCSFEYSMISSQAAAGRNPCYSNNSIIKTAGGRNVDVTDIRPFDQYSGPAKLAGVKGAKVTFSVIWNTYQGAPKETKCLLTYRAVDANGKKLGTPPAPCPSGTPGCVSKSKPPSCPAGSYVAKNIDGNTLCLLCPPGTYRPTSNTRTTCAKCPAGKFAAGYGGKACGTCPAGTYSFAGDAQCQTCSQFFVQGVSSSWYSDKPNSPTCLPCPANTLPESSDIYPNKVTRCLGVVSGNLCCAAGDCKGQVACPKNLQPYTPPKGAAIFKMTSSKLTDPSCKPALLLNCLKPSGLLRVQQDFSLDRILFKSFNRASCQDAFQYIPSYYGMVVATNRVRFQGEGLDANFTAYNEYEAVSDRTSRTLTMYYAKQADSDPIINPKTAKCSATFTLVAGYVMDIQPLPGAKCPANTQSVVESGRTLCRVCEAGNILKNGQCEACPVGTYQPLDGGSKCLACPRGTYVSYRGATSCSPCYGSSVPNAARSDCVPCKANTYTTSTECKPCPAGTFSPVGSTVCGYPFPK